LKIVQNAYESEGITMLKANTIRYYLHCLDGLKEEIEEIKRSIDLYKTMDCQYYKANCPEDSDGSQHFMNPTSAVEKIVIPRLTYISVKENELFNKMTILQSINRVLIYLNKNSTEYEILRLRYFYKPIGQKELTWKDIGDKVGYEDDYVRKIDCKLISAMLRNYDDTIKLFGKITQTVHKPYTDIDLEVC
jgi:hypothetical protein